MLELRLGGLIIDDARAYPFSFVSGGVKFVQNGRFEIHIDEAIARWRRAASGPLLTSGLYPVGRRQPQGNQVKEAKKNQVLDRRDPKKTNQEK